jgi:aminoglycoside phosphotransferase (APT) family kinase protein
LPLRSPRVHDQFFRLNCIKLEDQLTKLETKDVFAAMRNEVSSVVWEFAEKTLLGLSLFSSDKPSALTFTHYDFSPRNILVSQGSPRLVTGILDFEFAGFFPNEEEFTNNAIANNQDWPEAAYRVLLEELEKLGERTPL